MIQIKDINIGLKGVRISKKKEKTRLEFLKEFSKLSDYEKFLNNKVLPQNKNAWYWSFFKSIDEGHQYFKY